MAYRVGVDIGGTFTDFAALDDAHHLYTLKVFSTPGAPGQEIVAGLRGLRDRYGIEPHEISYFTFGTTVGVNSIIQRNGAQLCMVTTENFDDVLEIARLQTPDLLNLYSLRPRPLISKDRIFQVSERVLWDGSVEKPIDLENVRSAVAKAVQVGAEGLVVALINSYRNPIHELKIKQIAAEIAPDLLVTCSSEVWPVIREYERTVTAVLNAYVRPKFTRYLTSLQEALTVEGVTVEAQITKSNGGVMRAELGKSNCVDVLLSGTASGVTAASFVARLAGLGNVASFDVGGTSADVAFIVDAQPKYATEEQIGDFSLLIPSVSVSSIGGGGGSIAWIDDLGVLKSGPGSAGAEPGPACYNRGGDSPTTTDAFAVCGFLGQTEIAYGAVKINREKAENAIMAIAAPLGLGVKEAAGRVIEVAVSGMYAEMTKAFAAHGEEPKSFALMAFGGAGPMFACFVARELGINTILVPLTPGVLCALGGLLSDTKNDFIETVYCGLDDSSIEVLRAAFSRLKISAEDWLRNEQAQANLAQLSLSADMRYVGQSFEIEVPLQAEWIADGDISSIKDAFHERHLKIYNYSDPMADVQLINARNVIASENPVPDLPSLTERSYTPTCEKTIEVFYDGRYHEAALFRRETLQPGARFYGPAIVAQSDTTICILDGYQVRVDGRYNIIIEKSKQDQEHFQ